MIQWQWSYSDMNNLRHVPLLFCWETRNYFQLLYFYSWNKYWNKLFEVFNRLHQ